MLVSLAVGFPQISAAEGFTGDQFAQWSLEQQNAYIETSISMASALSGQAAPEFGACLDAWYFSEDDARGKRNAALREVISKYGTHHPSVVLVGALVNVCGKPD